MLRELRMWWLSKRDLVEAQGPIHDVSHVVNEKGFSMSLLRRSSEKQIPHWLLLSMLANSLFLVGIVGIGVLYKAWASDGARWADTFPWAQMIQGLASLATIAIAWAVKSEVKNLHITINSNMAELMRLNRKDARADAVIEERARVQVVKDGRAAAREEGRQEEMIRQTGLSEARAEGGAVATTAADAVAAGLVAHDNKDTKSQDNFAKRAEHLEDKGHKA